MLDGWIGLDGLLCFKKTRKIAKPNALFYYAIIESIQVATEFQVSFEIFFSLVMG